MISVTCKYLLCGEETSVSNWMQTLYSMVNWFHLGFPEIGRLGFLKLSTFIGKNTKKGHFYILFTK